jgi:hypothetical protein
VRPEPLGFAAHGCRYGGRWVTRRPKAAFSFISRSVADLLSLGIRKVCGDAKNFCSCCAGDAGRHILTKCCRFAELPSHRGLFSILKVALVGYIRRNLGKRRWRATDCGEKYGFAAGCDARADFREMAGSLQLGHVSTGGTVFAFCNGNTESASAASE